MYSLVMDIFQGDAAFSVTVSNRSFFLEASSVEDKDAIIKEMIQVREIICILNSHTHLPLILIVFCMEINSLFSGSCAPLTCPPLATASMGESSEVHLEHRLIGRRGK